MVEDGFRTADESGASVNDGVLVSSCEGDGLATLDIHRSHWNHPVLCLREGDVVYVAGVE